MVYELRRLDANQQNTTYFAVRPWIYWERGFSSKPSIISYSFHEEVSWVQPN